MAKKNLTTCSKQEEKAKSIQQDVRAQQLAEFHNLIAQIQKDHGIFYRHEFDFLRTWVDYVEDHRDEYPRTRSLEKVDFAAEARVTIPCTNGFVESLASQTFKNDGSCSPVVQVFKIETCFRDGAIGHERVKMTNASIIDGDGNALLCVFAVHLMEASRLLTEGSLVRLKYFSTSNYRVNNASPRLPWILVLNFTHLGKSELIVDKARIQTPETKPLGQLQAAPDDDVDDNGTTVQQPLDTEKFEPIPDLDLVCSPTHRECAMHDIGQVVCICKAIPLRALDLEVISESCYFVDREVRDMEPWHKRNVLYWWYATNHYNLCGKFRRGRLPRCLVRMIRTAYPNPLGVAYKGFVDYQEDDVNRKRRRHHDRHY